MAAVALWRAAQAADRPGGAQALSGHLGRSQPLCPSPRLREVVVAEEDEVVDLWRRRRWGWCVGSRIHGARRRRASLGGVGVPGLNQGPRDLYRG